MTRNTNHHFHESIFSQRKADSGTQKNIINLGKMLVQDLGLEEGNDTLAKWMAHYIAEQIVNAEKSEGDEKSNAENACFDTILKLWSHRSALPNGKRPFESFDSIFRAIESFDPENKQSRYFLRWEDEPKANLKKRKKQVDQTKEWIDVAKCIDRAARVLIQYSFKQAAVHAADVKTRNWISNTIDQIDSEETSAILRIILTNKTTSGEEENKRAHQQCIDGIQSKIDMLDAFKEASEELRKDLNAELQEQLKLISLVDTGEPKKVSAQRKARKKGKE